MKVLRAFISVTIIVALAVLIGRTPATAGKGNNKGQGHQIQLRDLAGTTAEAAQGSAVFCHDPSTGAGVACSTPGAVAVPFTFLSVGPVIRDAKGNACGSFTETLSDVPPDANPPLVIQFQVGGQTTSYDPQTATGDGPFTSFSGAKCVGAVATGGTAVGTGTAQFTASQGGDRIVFILTTLPGVGAFSISGFDHRE